MNDMEVIKAIVSAPIAVELSVGQFTVKPLSINRSTRLAALLKSVQGDPARFKDTDNPDFYKAVAEALVATGEKMPEALVEVTGDPAFKDKDLTLLDLLALAKAVLKVNSPSLLLAGFREAMEVMKLELK